MVINDIKGILRGGYALQFLRACKQGCGGDFMASSFSDFANSKGKEDWMRTEKCCSSGSAIIAAVCRNPPTMQFTHIDFTRKRS